MQDRGFYTVEQAASLLPVSHNRISRKLDGSADPLEDGRHLLLVVGSERGGSYGAHRAADLEEVGAHGFVVRRLEDGDHVVGSHGPIGLLQLQPVFLGDLAAVVGPLGGLLDVPYALVRKVDQDHVGGHTIPSSSFKAL